MHRVAVIGVGIAIAAMPAPVAVTGSDAPSVERYTIELADVDRQALIQAPHHVMNRPPSDDLARAIAAGDIDSVEAERIIKVLDDDRARKHGVGIIAYLVGDIHYAPRRHSSTRIYRPKIRCVSHGDSNYWSHCQNESWIRLKTDAMQQAIQFKGDLSDKLVERALGFIDEARIESPIDGEIITAQRVFRIFTHAQTGRIHVGVRRMRNEGWYTFYLKTYLSAVGTIDLSASFDCCNGY